MSRSFAVGLPIMACCTLGLVACRAKPEPVDLTNQSNSTVPSVAQPVVQSTMDLLRDGSGQACAAADVKRAVEETVQPDTSGAKTLAGSGLYPFHSADVDGFAAAINVSLVLETQAGADKAISSVKCDGEIDLSAPAYHMPAEQKFNISYEVRPSAENPNNFVISANTGMAKAVAQSMLDQIVEQTTNRLNSQASQQAAAAQQAQAQQNLEAARHPSFSCLHVTSYVLNTICGNQSLIDLDNQLAASYRAASIKADQKGDTFAKLGLVSDERAWIAKRQQCADANCITDLYRSRIEELSNGTGS